VNEVNEVHSGCLSYIYYIYMLSFILLFQQINFVDLGTLEVWRVQAENIESIVSGGRDVHKEEVMFTRRK